MNDPNEKLTEIAKQVRTCQRCALHTTRKNSVPGEGRANTDVMFIGEGPGYHENEQGRPFVGQAGKFLAELLHAANLARENVFITNVVKCRPPSNRDPEPGELATCNEFLEQQIEAINPRVIVTLGRFSMGKFLPLARISEAHGKPVWVKDRLIVPMYHPAAALHQPKLKPTLLHDFSCLPEVIRKAVEAHEAAKPAPVKTPENKESHPAEEAKQMDLF